MVTDFNANRQEMGLNRKKFVPKEKPLILSIAIEIFIVRKIYNSKF